ncbi:MAG: hypothetical protein N2202_07140 [Proteobacteria bacterium]|nr:hypothetical protein [Pseudomonadota bacterium]
MQSNLICPFFNTTKDDCEIGKDFIDIEEANSIIDLCICNFRSCKKYKMIKQRRICFSDFIKEIFPIKIQMGGRNE